MSLLHPVPSPRDHLLDEAVATLASRRDSVGVVRVVEAWASQGTPTPRARLAQARAFFTLRLMDRALHRTREVLEGEPDQPDALLLLGQVYVERGWPMKARKPLQTLRELRADEGDGARLEDRRAEVDALWARAHEEPVRPEATAREVEREGQPARLLALAEGFLATGSFLRATGILERLRRADPENPRVKELLWSLAGDFGSGGLSPEALVATLLPPRVASAREREQPEEPEHTESFDLRAADLDADDPTGVNFPALFKYALGAPVAADADPQEATQASGLASPAQMGQPGGDGTDPGRRALVDVLPSSDPGDTQIMLVLRPGEDRPPGIHRRRDEGADPLRDTLNLRAWQQSMGVESASDLDDARDDLLEEGDDLLEEEDENVVVMTRGESTPAGAPAPALAFASPIEVVEKHARPPDVSRTPAPTQKAAPPSPPRRPSGDPPPPRAGGITRMIGAGAALVVATTLLLAVVALGSLGTRTSSSPVRDDLVRALALEDYNALLTQEGRLEQRLGSRERASEIADVRAALAEARLALWSDYNGDPTRIEKVREAVADAARMDAHRVAILRAAEALARQDIDGASAAVGRERPADDEERLLFARIAARAGDLPRALEHLDAIEHPTQPRYRLARAEILAGAGQRDEARALVQAVLQQDAAHVNAQMLALELADAAPADSVAAADAFLAAHAGPGLAPRIEGRVQVLRARAFTRMNLPDQARDAAERGLARDGTNPDLLFLRAADLAGGQHLTEALHELDTVVGAHPGDGDAQAAYVLLLLDLDRVEEADAAVARLESARMLPNLSPVLRALVSVWGRQERPAAALLPPQQETALGAYATALLAVQERAPDALAALQTAITALGASADPFERRLAPRLVAMEAVVAGAPAGDAFVRQALDAGSADPAVHVFLGRYYEASDRKALAAQHFDRASQLGPELGLAWYEKGRFYLDARDGFARSGAAWRNFLALAPSGARATRAKDTLGIR
jgi:tetratricopeptide (TPR) repeat protein